MSPDNASDGAAGHRDAADGADAASFPLRIAPSCGSSVDVPRSAWRNTARTP